MISSLSRGRLIECMELTWAHGFGVEPVAPQFGPWATEEPILGHDDVRLMAMADLIIPFAEAELIPERERVGWLPSPETIRDHVSTRQLNSLVMSVGAQLAVNPGLLFAEAELADDWSTWLTYWSYAYSPRLRGTLHDLSAAVKVLEAFTNAPMRRDERLTFDGEHIVCVVPTRGREEQSHLLDTCEVVLEHVDTFATLGKAFAMVLEELKDKRSGSWVEFSDKPFDPGLWPYTPYSLERVYEIASLARTLGRTIRGDDEGDALAVRAEQLVL